MAAGIGDSSLFAFIQTVHARYAAAVIYFVGFGVDAGRLAVAGAKSAAVSLRGVYDGFEEGVFGQETEHRTHWANRVAVGAPASPCQDEQYDKSNCGYDEGGQAFHPHLRFVEGIAVCPLRQVCQQVVTPLIDRSKKVGSDTPVGTVWLKQRSDGMETYACNEGNEKQCQHSIAQPFSCRGIAETVFLPFAGKPGNDILKYTERTDYGAIDASEQ